MKTNIKNKILKLFALLTMLTCIVITFLGSNFKPMKNTYADENQSVFVNTSTLLSGDFADITDFRRIKEGDILSGVKIYYAADVSSALANLSGLIINFIKPACHTNIQGDMPLSVSCSLQFADSGYMYFASSSSFSSITPLVEVSTAGFFTMLNVQKCSDLDTDEYVCKSGCDYQLVVEDLSYTTAEILDYIVVRDSEVTNIYDNDISDDPTEEPSDEPTDETPGIIEGLGDETLAFLSDALGVSASAAMGIALLLIIYFVFFRKK